MSSGMKFKHRDAIDRCGQTHRNKYKRPTVLLGFAVGGKLLSEKMQIDFHAIIVTETMTPMGQPCKYTCKAGGET